MARHALFLIFFSSIYFCVVLCIFVFYVLFVLCRSLYCLCVYAYLLLPPGDHPIAIKYISYIITYHIILYIIYHIYHTIYIIYHIIPYHIVYHISCHIIYHISYHIIYHIIPYHIVYHISYHIIYHISYYIIYHISYEIKSTMVNKLQLLALWNVILKIYSVIFPYLFIAVNLLHCHEVTKDCRPLGELRHTPLQVCL